MKTPYFDTLTIWLSRIASASTNAMNPTNKNPPFLVWGINVYWEA